MNLSIEQLDAGLLQSLIDNPVFEQESEKYDNAKLEIYLLLLLATSEPRSVGGAGIREHLLHFLESHLQENDSSSLVFYDGENQFKPRIITTQDGTKILAFPKDVISMLCKTGEDLLKDYKSHIKTNG